MNVILLALFNKSNEVMSGDKEWVIFFEIKESKINEYVDLYKNKPRIAYLKLC